MKLLFRLFLSLSFLLLGGYSSIYAYSYPAPVHHTSIKDLARSQDATFLHLLKVRSLTFRSSRSGGEIETDHLKAIEVEQEDEDDKQTSLKKCSTIGSYLATFFYAPTTDNLCSPIKIRLSFSKHFPFSSFGRYLAFGVFRI